MTIANVFSAKLYAGKLPILLSLIGCRLWAGYVTDGLILHFDAIDNSGIGVHSDNPSVWKDLSVSGCDLTLPASGVTVGADSITLAKTVATLTGVSDLANAALTNFTVEVLARTDESFVPKTNNRQLIYNNRFGITFRDLASGRGFIVANIFHPPSSMYWYRVAPRCTDWNNVPFIRNFHTYSLRVTASYSTSRIAIDNGLYQTLGAQFTSEGGKTLTDTLTLGSTDCNFIYQSIRIYNRHLTEAEMRQNLAEDTLRYPKAAISDPHATTNVFSDALYWFNGARGTGETVYTQSNTVANVLWAGTAECPDGDRSGQVKGATSNLVVETMDVVCPYMRRTLRNRRTLHFRQCCWTNDNNIVRASTATYRQSVNGNFTNGAPYSVVVRFKVDSFMAPNNYANLLYLGYAWTNESGLWWQLRGSKDNMWVRAYHGSNGDPFTDMTNKPAYRLSCGKWVDMALVVEEGTRNRLYYRTEDGELYEGTRNDAIVRSKDNRSYEFVLGASDTGSAYDGTTGANASSLYSFRGWFDQLAIWGRALSRDEVLQAFRGGCDDYDACRVGVPNGGNGEFGGTGDADLNDSQAWINMTNALPIAGSSVKVRFDLPADRVQFARTFRFTSTPFSQDGATIRVRLNGHPIAERLSVAAGMTAVADVPAGCFVPSGNVLEITRTDDGDKTLEIDCLAITEAIGAVVDPVGAATVEDDVYSDAYCWYRWPEDDDGNGYLLSGSTNATFELRDALRAGNPRHDSHLWYRHSYVSYSNFVVTAQSVTCPARGVTLADEPCLRLQYPTWTNGAGEVVGSWGGLERGHSIFAVSNATGYSALARIKFDGYMAPSSDHAQVMGTGYEWGNKRGACLSLYGDTNNMYVAISCGYSNLSFTDTQTGASANRLQTGKWIDIGYTVSNGWFRLYTFVEGGELVEQLQSGGSGALGEPGPSSKMFIGSSSGGGENKATSGLFGFNGLFHQVAVWPRMLTKEEMLKAMGWPKPDLVRLGTDNGSALEFTGGVNPFTADSSAFRTASSGVNASSDAYVVAFDVSAVEADRNQQLSVAATAASVSEAVFAIELNGEPVQYYDDTTGVVHTELSVPAGACATFGIHNSYLVAGRNTLRLLRTDGLDGLFELDALSLGNGGKRVRVLRRPFFHVIIR